MPYKDPVKRHLCRLRFNAKHKEQRKEYNRKWRIEHKELCRAQRKRWRDKYPEKRKAEQKISNKKWRSEHPGIMKVLIRKWRLDNPIRVKLQRRIWCISNQEKIRAFTLKYRAQKRNASGFNYTTAQHIMWRWGMWGNKRYICGNKATATDHVIPLFKGGSHFPANLRPICARCNSSKRDKSLNVFMAEMKIEGTVEQRSFMFAGDHWPSLKETPDVTIGDEL